MFIEQLDSTRLLITLEQEDLNTFELEPYSISLENTETKSLLKQLLTLAAIKAGVPIRDRVLSVETLPYDCGCFLLVTIKPREKRRTYKIKNDGKTILTAFPDTEAMLNAVQQLYSSPAQMSDCSLFEHGGIYYLTLTHSNSDTQIVRGILEEYGEILPCGSLSKSRLSEFYNTVCENDAIEKIGSQL